MGQRIAQANAELSTRTGGGPFTDEDAKFNKLINEQAKPAPWDPSMKIAVMPEMGEEGTVHGNTIVVGPKQDFGTIWHERQHVLQNRRWGPASAWLYDTMAKHLEGKKTPVSRLVSLAFKVKGTRSYDDHPFEKEAEDARRFITAAGHKSRR